MRDYAGNIDSDKHVVPSECMLNNVIGDNGHNYLRISG